MVLHQLHDQTRKKSLRSSSARSFRSLFSPLLVVFFVVVGSSSSSVSAESIPSNVNNEDDIVTFTLHDNGSSGEGLEVTLHRSEFGSSAKDFALEMSTRIEVSKYMAQKPVLADRAFREDGESIKEFDQLKPDTDTALQRRIYLVAEDLEFIWPYIEYGHQQVVSTNVVPPVGGEPVVLESVSETPRVFRVWNMATAEEATAVIDRALNATGNDALKRSTVGSGTDDSGNELKKEDYGRTSDNAWDWSSPAAKAMIKRSFQLTNIEENDGKRDGLQVVRYKPGQGYNTHPDYFTPERQRTEEDFDFLPYSGGSNRFATVFMYLNTPEEGGATVFPQAHNQDPRYTQAKIKPVTQPPQQSTTMFQEGTWQHLVNNNCYDPAKVAVQPRQGTAALFYSITPDGRIDPSSHHAACPLLDGTKWGANIWIWNKQRFGDLRTGNARKLRITNRIMGEPVHISWEGKPNGVLAPGQSFNMDTFEHHRFKVSFGSHKEKSFASFTVEECEEGVMQKWEIVEPPNYHHNRRRRQLQEDSNKRTRDYDDDDDGGRQVKQQKNDEMAVNTKNYLNEKVEILWQGQPLGIDIDGGDTVKLYTFVGHTLQAISTTTSSIISTLKVLPDSNIWRIGGEDDSSSSGHHGDEL